MLKIHHLVMSRSDRIVWLAEELGLKYELVRHDRDPATFRAPASLKACSPMGKSPLIQDGELTLAESGAIVEYLIGKYGKGSLRPAADSRDFPAYLHWMHAAESTLMLPILFDMLGTMMQVQSAAVDGFVRGEYKNVLGYLNSTLSANDYVAGSSFSGADIMVAYDLQLANGSAIPVMTSKAPLAEFPAITAYLQRIERRPAFIKARGLCAP